VTFAGRFERVHDAVVLPRPVPPPPLMIGSPGDRVLRAALAHVDAWNVWSTCTGTRLTGSRERIPASVSSFASPGGTPPTSCTVQRCSSRLKVVEEIDRRRSTHRHSQGLPTGSPTGSRNSPRLASTRRFCRQPNHRTLNPSARRQPSPFSARPHGGTRDRVRARYRDPRRAAWRGSLLRGSVLHRRDRARPGRSRQHLGGR
jgi:alkanesulfonate monooxygenase SsuD/methylene tetrahydromethanopterin reductase-like flavin-dependent oxidoreductase (luciferase family)